MADRDLSSPLLPSHPQHLTLTVNDSDFGSQYDNKITTDDNNGHHQDSWNSHSHNNTRKPFDVIGSKGLEVPGPATLDPFRNETLRIDGLYEWVKIAVCLPIAAVRLVLFGVCLLLGFLATKVALLGWKDKHNSLPRWRSRIMWVTRICARCILFSFGYHWIRRKGKPALREIAPIVVSNHVSYIEPIFYFYELYPTIVAAECHDSIPLVGTIIRSMQVIYVNRFSPSSRKHAVNEIKLFDTEMCFQGSEYRERLLAIDFPDYYYFPREPRLMEGSLSHSNLVHSSQDTQSNLWLSAILTYTLTNHGGISLWQSLCLECSHNFTILWRWNTFL